MDKAAVEAARLAFLANCPAYQADGECSECEYAIENQLLPALDAYIDAAAKDKANDL